MRAALSLLLLMFLMPDAASGSPRRHPQRRQPAARAKQGQIPVGRGAGTAILPTRGEIEDALHTSNAALSCRSFVTDVQITAADPVLLQVAASRYGASDFPRDGSLFLILASGDPFQPGESDLDVPEGVDEDSCVGDLAQVDITFDFPPGSVQSLAFDFDFFSFEFPEYVDSPYNDYAFAFLDGIPLKFATPGKERSSCFASAGNGGCLITKDALGNPTNVNDAFFRACSVIGCDSPSGTPGWDLCDDGASDCSDPDDAPDCDDPRTVPGPGCDAGRTGTLTACSPITCPPSQITQGVHTLTLIVGDAGDGVFLHKMLLDAFNMRASDLHFEPYEHQYRVRFRIDGELREITSPPIAIKDKLASRIKVISRLDISEKRVPQDGRMKLKVGPDRVIDFRVSTLPTLFGEKIVIRILDPSSAKLGIDALGYEAVEKERLLAAIGRPYGMVLVTGPTGSGKTVSLYTCLNLLNKPGVNIATAEDPSEINLPGVNQVNVNEKAGLTFATALKAFLRQDPDIIMVGEIRDLETADISIKAAQTGHLVLSTLHTNDAPTTLTRMRNMGIAPFNIASSVILITAQRLARRLCPLCKTPADIPYEALVDAGFAEEEVDGSWVAYRPVGCSACNNGYKGRLGIYQVMPITEEIQRIILRDGSALEIAEQAKREGVRSLRDAGLHKVKLGLTSLEEVLAVTNE